MMFSADKRSIFSELRIMHNILLMLWSSWSRFLLMGGALKVAEQALVSSTGGSQHSNGTSLLEDYEKEVLVESEGGGEVEKSKGRGVEKREKKEKEKRN